MKFVTPENPWKLFQMNLHLFLPAFLLTIAQVLFGYFYPDFTEIDREYDYYTLWLLLLIATFPFCALDPPVWFSVYMTTLIHLLYFRGMFTFSIVAFCVMLVALFVQQYQKSPNYATDLQKSESKNRDECGI